MNKSLLAANSQISKLKGQISKKSELQQKILNEKQNEKLESLSELQISIRKEKQIQSQIESKYSQQINEFEIELKGKEAEHEKTLAEMQNEIKTLENNQTKLQEENSAKIRKIEKSYEDRLVKSKKVLFPGSD